MNLFSRLFGIFSTTNTNTIVGASTAGSGVESVRSDLTSRKVTELRTMAKTMGLSGYSSMRKSELVTYIEENTIR